MAASWSHAHRPRWLPPAGAHLPFALLQGLQRLLAVEEVLLHLVLGSLQLCHLTLTLWADKQWSTQQTVSVLTERTTSAVALTLCWLLEAAVSS